MTEVRADFVKSIPEMLEALEQSARNGTTVGICSPALGTGIYITAVDKILYNSDFFDKSEITIVLKNYDVTGYFFSRNVLKLYEVRAVWPLLSPFENPFYRKDQN